MIIPDFRPFVNPPRQNGRLLRVAGRMKTHFCVAGPPHPVVIVHHLRGAGEVHVGQVPYPRSTVIDYHNPPCFFESPVLVPKRKPDHFLDLAPDFPEDRIDRFFPHFRYKTLSLPFGVPGFLLVLPRVCRLDFSDAELCVPSSPPADSTLYAQIS